MDVGLFVLSDFAAFQQLFDQFLNRKRPDSQRTPAYPLRVVASPEYSRTK